MKKVYSKPEIVFESFSLSQSIAAGCEHKTKKSESLVLSGLGFAFNSDPSACDVDVVGNAEDMEFGDGICYHVFSSNGASNVFSS